MRPRYLMLLTAASSVRAATDRLAAATGLRCVLATGRLALLANEACACLPIEGAGAVLGTLFPRHGPPRALNAFDDDAQAALARGRTEVLLDRYWGSYVAAFASGERIEVLRDPSGGLPCYWSRCSGETVFASDVDLLIAAGAVEPRIDWPALTRFLALSGLPVPETALVGVRELLAGFAVWPDQPESEAAIWSPWDFADVPCEAAATLTPDRLRQIVRNCIAAWASRSSRAIVSLSGGLDSSLVTAGLAGGGGTVSCLTMYGADPAGDERPFARALCAEKGLTLFEHPYELTAIDIQQALGSHLPRPIGRVQDQAYEAAHIALARMERGDTFFTGNGGDNVFGYSQSAAPIADRIRYGGSLLGALQTTRDVCRQTGSGPLRALGAGLRLAMRSPAYRWRANRSFLNLEPASEALALHFLHPWLMAPRGALPGKAAHIAAILRAQFNLEPGRSRYAPVVNPLLSQPIVEACLSVPSWTWRKGGRDRALAREAFADDLPAAILQRRAKGTPDQFCAAVLRHFREPVRARLLGGHLAAHGIVDRHALGHLLGAAGRPGPVEIVRLFEFLNVEAWLDHWIGRGAA